LLGRSIVYYLAEEAFKQRGDDQTAKRIGAAHPSAKLKNTGPSLCGHRKHPFSSSKEMHRLFVGKCFPNNDERTPNAHFDRRTCLLGAQQKRVDIIIIIIITRVLFEKKLMMKTSIEDKS
jgi:hypothetical protein